MFRFVATTGTGFILQYSTISCSLCTAYNTMHWNILPGVTTVHRQLGMLGRFAGMQCTVNLSATEKKFYSENVHNFAGCPAWKFWNGTLEVVRAARCATTELHLFFSLQ